jgi:hypothetical protein
VSEWFIANLALLPAGLRAAVEQAARPGDLAIGSARDGSPNLAAKRDGHQYWLHSTYSPSREAERLCDQVSEGTILVLGFGLGYHIEPLLERARRVLVIEPDLMLFRAALQSRSLVTVLANRKVSLCVGSDLAATEEFLLTSYLPALHGSLSAVELPGRIRSDEAVFTGVRTAVARATERIKDDLAVQARMAHKWLRNTLLNLGRARPAAFPVAPGSKVAVAAAGPSLDDQIEWVRSNRSDVALLAVDTALGPLSRAGVSPDAVMSVDCQVATYHHYLLPGRITVPVIAELSVLPSLWDHWRSVVPVFSTHPLHLLLRLVGLKLPVIDVSGGSVTNAAVAAALAVGAGEVILLGADFSYPEGAVYAHGSFVHNLAAARAERTTPAEGTLYAFLQDRPGLVHDPGSPSRLLQPALTGYRRALEAMALRASVPIRQVPGRGTPLDLPASPETANPASAATAVAHDDGADWRPALRRVAELLSALPQGKDLGEAVYSGDQLSEQAVRSLLPLAARLQIVEDLSIDEALDRSAAETLRMIDFVLTR